MARKVKAKGNHGSDNDENLFSSEEPTDKSSELNSLADKMKKTYGKNSIIRLDDEDEECSVLSGQVVSSGVPQIDRATHIGGLPYGRIVEIFGPEASGKTSVCLLIAAMTEAEGKNVLYVDVEHALVKKHVLNCGVRKMQIARPDNGDDAFKIIREYIPYTDVIILDSVSALLPKAEGDKEVGDAAMASQARLMSQALRILNGEVAKHNVLLIFINQIRLKVGLVFGNPEVTSGGQALKFYASMRIDVRKKDALKQGDEVIGFKSKIKIVKNKMDSPLGEEEFTLFFDANRTIPANVLDFATEIGVVSKATGGWYSYKEERIAQGYINAIQALIENKDLFDRIRDECRANLFKPVAKLDSVL